MKTIIIIIKWINNLNIEDVKNASSFTPLLYI